MARSRYGTAATMDFEAPLTSLVWLTSVISIVSTWRPSHCMARMVQALMLSPAERRHPISTGNQLLHQIEPQESVRPGN